MKLNISDENREYYHRLWKIGFPIMVQQLIIVAVQLCDTVMVGKLSEEALAAVGAANQIFFVYIDCMFGLLSGLGVLSVQYWGIRDLGMLRKILGIGYSVSSVVGVILTFVVYIFAPELISLFSADELVIQLGTDYIRIAVFTYVVGTLTYVISYNSRVIAKLKWPTIFNAIAVGTNIFLNWCWIFGKFGFEAMGVRGAAYATLVARILEFLLTIIYIYTHKDHPLKAKLHEMKYDKELFVRCMKTAGPVVLNELLWVLSFSTIFAIYGKISAQALAVVQIAMTISDIFMAMYCGVSNTCTVIVGEKFGQGNRDLGYHWAGKTIKFTLVLNVISTIIFILSRDFIVSIYSFGPETNALLVKTIIVFAIALSPKMFAYVFICGILRTGGDTIFTAIIDAGINWILMVPLAWLSVVKLGWNLPQCLLLVMTGDILKAVLGIIRYKSKKWINVFTGR